MTINFVEYGEGTPVIGLHGAGVDHREIEAALEATLRHEGLRRIYPDLPAMGRSTADGLESNHDVVTLLDAFIEEVGGGESVALIGHSYGAHLARGVAAQHSEQVRALALLCPTGEGTGDVPDHGAVREDTDAHDELEPELRKGFDDYFVVRTARTARRYRDRVVPGTTLVDEEALGRVFSGWTIDVTNTFTGPTLIIAGRHDSTVGYRDATELLDTYPHATLTIVDDAGHALMHERPELVSALLADLLGRA